MTKSSMLYINHIIGSINLIDEFVHNISKEDFAKDRMRYDAVLYNLQIMAESTQKLPQNIKEENSHIPWRDISGFRNILVHDYLEGRDEDIIWSIVTEKLSPIKEVMLKIREKNVPTK